MKQDAYQLIFETSRDPLCVLDHRYRLVQANPVMTAALGLGAAPEGGAALLELAHPDDRDRLREGLSSLLGERGDASFSCRFIVPGGREVRLEWHAAKALPDGRILAFARKVALEPMAQAMEEHLIRSMSGLMEPVSFLSPEGAIVDMNEPACKLFGCGRDESLGGSMGQFFPDWDADRWGRHWAELKEKGSLRLEIPARSRTGGELVLDVCCNYFRAGRQELAFGIMRDITERQRIEAALRESERKYRLLAENSADIIVLHRRDHYYAYVSPACMRVLGYTPEEMIGRRPGELVHPEDREVLASSLQKAFSEQGISSYVARFRHRDGHYVWLDTSYHAIVGPENGRPAEVLCITRDITERKLAEDKIWRAYQRQKTHFEQTFLGSIEFDLEGRITQWNAAAERIFGHSPQEAVGQSWKMLAVPCREGDPIGAYFERLMLAGHPIRSEIECQARDGRRLFCEWYGTPLVDSQGGVFAIAAHVLDVTEERQAKRLIEEQRLKIVSASKMSALGEMAGSVAHEINNPLAIISGNASLLVRLLRDGAQDPEAAVRHAQNIIDTCQRIARIVRGLRSLSRDGSSDPYVPFPLRHVVSDVLELCQSKFDAAGISLGIRTEIPEALLVECRPVQVSQVLLNLLSNAFDAVISLQERWVSLEVADSGAEVEIRVVDSGPGIPREMREKVFLPFFTTKGVGHGTGLGLSISHAIVAEHGGSMAIDPDRAHTCFVVALPKRRTAALTRGSAGSVGSAVLA